MTDMKDIQQLPRDVYLKIIGFMCCDVDTRIILGIVHKLRIPLGLKERLGALAKPEPDQSGTTLLKLGYNKVSARHKMVLYYRQFDGFHEVGVLIAGIDEIHGSFTTCMRCDCDNMQNTCCFEEPFSYT